ncbi:MAG: response regulator [Elusimicrobiota bacterium]|nr:response regulator [Elusimicrobiota bacterium]
MNKIMIVEDDRTTVKLLKYLLEKHGYETVSFENGKDAVDAIQEEKPDLILMDIMMPEMNGLEATEKIREIPELADTPIIILSALGQEMEVTKGLKVGADGYVVKPFDTQSLLRHIKEQLSS